MYLNILDDNRKKLLIELNSFSFIKDFYLAGGTGLSLMIGIRESFDFSFFTNKNFNAHFIYDELKKFYNDRISIVNVNDYETCDVLIDNIKVSFFGYHYNIVNNFYTNELYENINIASIEDIQCMKLTSIGRGGSKKDFFDLYFILLTNKISVKTLVELYINKYGINSMNYIIMGLTYFDDAENEVLPQTFVSYDFKKIKKYFLSVSKEIINELNKIS